ncbi:uncharacterized protein RCO7_01473 [Rhynchosporium graminicola]|uniref:Uncharacterized protein n=1 Tax=Rhynchosporium graminicola TaxID=2792576 RepID=A0A1E1JZ64_9HELO|nr:uncharacterized protein RCO7_01473 [Rhynchosporium commune]
MEQSTSDLTLPASDDTETNHCPNSCNMKQVSCDSILPRSRNPELPNELIAQIISQAELKTDLASWCLVSRAGRSFATPYLYREFWTAKAGQNVSVRDVITSLEGFLNLSKFQSEKVRSFEARYITGRSNIEMFDMFKMFWKCFNVATRLESFVMSCPLPPYPSFIAPILQLETLASFTIYFPSIKSHLHEYRENAKLERELLQLNNLKSFKVYNVWLPSWATARRIVTVLRNSPKLLEFGISLHEGPEFLQIPSELVFASQPSPYLFFHENPAERPRGDTCIFNMIFEEFCNPTDPVTGRPLSNNTTQSTPRLNLKRLYVGNNCYLPAAVSQLTNLEVLEEMSLSFLHHDARSIWAGSAIRINDDVSLSDIARLASGLKRINFSWTDIEDRDNPSGMTFPSSTALLNHLDIFRMRRSVLLDLEYKLRVKSLYTGQT